MSKEQHRPKMYLRKKAVAERYGCHERTVDRMAEDGRIPSPIHKGKVPTLGNRRARCERPQGCVGEVALGVDNPRTGGQRPGATSKMKGTQKCRRGRSRRRG